MKDVGVSFNDFHTFRDWGLHFEDYDISEPVAITRYIDIPGRKTKIDATEALFGRIPYENRTLTMNFWIACRHSAWMRLDSQIQRAIGGKRCKIVFDTEPDRYWIGRVTVKPSRVEDAEFVLAHFTITCDVEPYKYWEQDFGEWEWDPFSFVDGYIQNLTDLQVSGTLRQKVMITVPAYPVITSITSMSVQINGKSYSLKAGQSIQIDDELEEGEHEFIFTGTGKVTISLKGETL